TNVAGAYLIDAVRLYNGEPPAETTHGPLFAFLVFLIFKWFGVSIVAAAIFVKFCFVLAILFLFLFLNELFGKWVAFVTGILVILSKPIYTQFALHIYLDVLVLMFEMLFLWLWVKAHRSEERKWFVLAGLSLGLALLAKENALLLLPLPLAAAFVLHRLPEKTVRRELAMLYFSFGLVLLPWLIFLQAKGDPSLILGWLAPTRDNAQEWGAVLEGKTIWENILLYNPFSSLWYLFSERIFGAEPLGRLYAISLVFVFLKVLFARRREELLYGLALLSSLPLAILTGAFGDRLGHMPEFLFLVHSTLPVAVLGAQELIARRNFSVIRIGHFKYHLKEGVRVGVAATLAIGLVGVFVAPSYRELFAEQGFGTGQRRFWVAGELAELGRTYRTVAANLRLPTSDDLGRIAGRHNTELQDAGHWLIENTPPDTFIVSDGVYDDAIRFFTRMQRPVIGRLYPPMNTMSAFSHHDPHATRVKDVEPLKTKGKVIFMTNTPLKYRSKYYRYRALLYLVFEESLEPWLRLILHPKAVVLINRESKTRIAELDEFFFNSPAFTHVYGKGAVRVLKPNPLAVTALSKIDFPSQYSMESRVAEDLRWLKEHYPQEFALIVDVLEKAGSSEMLRELERKTRG
ncbi:MAG: glycosyltransferase family 39 protein, partial [Candidatus Binatia bacterium]